MRLNDPSELVLLPTGKISVAAGGSPAESKPFAAGTAASCILAFQPFGCKTERLRDPGCLGSG
jgi:hypothetical protein